jgi:hypothetical protein
MAWKFQNPVATLENGRLSGQIDISQPNSGLHRLGLDRQTLTGRICGVERDDPSRAATATWSAKPFDAYLRGADLVASYQAADDWPFSPQVYWSTDTLAEHERVLGSLSLQVSISTHLLDTHPRICAVTQLVAEELRHLPANLDGGGTIIVRDEQDFTSRPECDAHCLVWRLPGGRLSYIEIVPASDFYVLKFRHHDDGTCEARWELIAEFLEKGVIRRTRLQAAFLPRQHDLEIAAECCKACAAIPLPLPPCRRPGPGSQTGFAALRRR